MGREGQSARPNRRSSFPTRNGPSQAGPHSTVVPVPTSCQVQGLRQHGRRFQFCLRERVGPSRSSKKKLMPHIGGRLVLMHNTVRRLKLDSLNFAEEKRSRRRQAWTERWEGDRKTRA